MSVSGVQAFCFVLFCFVWLATLGMPSVAPCTAAGPFRRVAEAPFSVPSSLVVERGALSTEVPPHLKTGAGLLADTISLDLEIAWRRGMRIHVLVVRCCCCACV